MLQSTFTLCLLRVMKRTLGTPVSCVNQKRSNFLSSCLASQHLLIKHEKKQFTVKAEGLEPELPAPSPLQRHISTGLRLQWLLMARYVKLTPYCFISGETSRGGGAKDLLHCSLPFPWRLQNCLALIQYTRMRTWETSSSDPSFSWRHFAAQKQPLSPYLHCPTFRMEISSFKTGSLELDQLLSAQHTDACRLESHGQSPRQPPALCSLKIWNKPSLYYIWQQNPVTEGKSLQLSTPSSNTARWHSNRNKIWGEGKAGFKARFQTNCLFCPPDQSHKLGLAEAMLWHCSLFFWSFWEVGLKEYMRFQPRSLAS